MNEEELLKQLQQYFSQNRSVDRTTPQGQPAYDPNQAKVWTDSFGLDDMFKSMGKYIDSQQYPGPQNMWEHNDMTLQRLLNQRNKKYSM